MRKISIVLTVLFSLLITSCSGKIMGYSVLLWNLPEYELQDGDVVPVYIKSNISHVYVIGVSGSKVEVPLWQLSEPVKKSKVKKIAAKYDEYKHQYAYVALDGLPMRFEPVNTAKQVYRLRKNENIKILYKGKGQAVMAGKNALEGDWLRVLTTDGTQGWCFSYNLRQYETDRNGQKIGVEIEEEVDSSSEEIETLLANIWYPESYKAMIDSGRIDVDKINTDYTLRLDSESKKLNFTMPKLSESWTYTGAMKTGDNQYKLNDIPVVITVRRQNFIVVRYTGESGKPEDFNLVTISEDLNELVQNEHNRRENEYEQLFLFGPEFKSDNYGKLVFKRDHSFQWAFNKVLTNSVLSTSARNYGSVSVKYFLSKSISMSYDGVLTFKFDGMDKEVNFLYKMEDKGLRLEDATGAVIKNNIVVNKGISPLVLFFSKQSE